MMIGVRASFRQDRDDFFDIGMDEGSHPEAHMDDCLAQGDVKDVCEDILKVISTFPEHVICCQDLQLSAG